MLEITVPPFEYFDEATNMFETRGELITIQLEHSLASLSKWERIWEKPFLTDDVKSTEETISYIQCMLLTPNVPSEVFTRLTRENYDTVREYIGRKMTATWFTERPGQKSSNKEIITAEIIYYWITALTLPFECQYWHLNTLFTLIKVTNEKNTPKKQQPRMGRATMAAQRRALAEQRRQQYNTTG